MDIYLVRTRGWSRGMYTVPHSAWLSKETAEKVARSFGTTEEYAPEAVVTRIKIEDANGIH